MPRIDGQIDASAAPQICQRLLGLARNGTVHACAAPVPRTRPTRPPRSAAAPGFASAGIDPGQLRIEPVQREWADALSHGDAEFTRRFAVPVEAGWAGFPEALSIIIASEHRDGPDERGPHLFFGEDGALIGNGGWKGPPADRAAEPGYAVAPPRQGRGVVTAVVGELVTRARAGRLRMVFAHTLAAQSASTSVLARCGFAKVAQLIDPDEGPVWRWELHLEDEAG